MNYKKVITAILLVSDGSINHSYFQENFDINIDELIKIFDDINTELNQNDYGFYIKYDNKSSDLVTIRSISSELADFKPPSILRGLSTPALETLSIVAYEQPVTKLKVSEIRGVESESSLKTLESRGLIEKSGTLDIPGNPYLYITTNLFLEKMNISTTEELPILGEVSVNRSIPEVGYIVKSKDEVYVNGKKIHNNKKHEYYRFYKPKGYVCSHNKQGNTPTIFELIEKDYLKFGGRLDKDSEGLMLLLSLIHI